MGIALSASGKRIRTIILVGPLIGGLPFNITVFLIPVSYALGIVPAILTAICAEIWFKSSTNRGREPNKWQIAAAGFLIGSLTCFLSASLAYLTFNRHASILLMDSDSLNLALIFSAMGGIGSMLFLPNIYGRFERAQAATAAAKPEENDNSLI